MPPPLERARQLLALATDPSATLEERRSVSVIAIEHIVKHGLLGSSFAAPDSSPVGRWIKITIPFGRVCSICHLPATGAVERSALDKSRFRHPGGECP